MLPSIRDSILQFNLIHKQEWDKTIIYVKEDWEPSRRIVCMEGNLLVFVISKDVHWKGLNRNNDVCYAITWDLNKKEKKSIW